MRSTLLKDLCDFRHGGTPSKAVPAYWSGDIPWVSPKDMKAATVCDASDRISEAAVANSATSIAPIGSTLLVVRSGILAHTLPVALVTAPVAFNQDIKAVVPRSPDASAAYIYWFLRSKASEVIARGVKKGATVHSVQSGFVEGLQVPVPASDEQQRIVDLLSRAEGIVRLRRQAQQKAAALIPAIFVDMFGDPATNPKGWPIAALGDVLAEPPTLGTMAKPSAVSGDWLDLRVANIQGGKLDLRDKKWLDLPAEQVDRFALRAGDIVLARAIGSLDHLGKAVIVNPPTPWTFDSHLMRLRLMTTRMVPEFFKAFLESEGGREAFLKHTRRSAVQFNINGKEVRQISIPLPPLDLQRQFVQRVAAVLAIEKQQQAATAKAEATFLALLARAFTLAGPQVQHEAERALA